MQRLASCVECVESTGETYLFTQNECRHSTVFKRVKIIVLSGLIVCQCIRLTMLKCCDWFHGQGFHLFSFSFSSGLRSLCRDLHETMKHTNAVHIKFHLCQSANRRFCLPCSYAHFTCTANPFFEAQTCSSFNRWTSLLSSVHCLAFETRKVDIQDWNTRCIRVHFDPINIRPAPNTCVSKTNRKHPLSEARRIPDGQFSSRLRSSRRIHVIFPSDVDRRAWRWKGCAISPLLRLDSHEHKLLYHLRCSRLSSNSYDVLLHSPSHVEKCRSTHSIAYWELQRIQWNSL